MTHVDKYLFVIAEDKEDAIAEIEGLLNEWREKEFYVDYEIIEDETKPVSGMPREFISGELDRVRDLLLSGRRKAEEERKAGNREEEGRALRTVSDILCEFFCEEMPWFNIEQWSWRVPEEREGRVKPGNAWWAVKVNFSFVEDKTMKAYRVRFSEEVLVEHVISVRAESEEDALRKAEEDPHGHSFVVEDRERNRAVSPHSFEIDDG
jgi:hypothetical protein